MTASTTIRVAFAGKRRRGVLNRNDAEDRADVRDGAGANAQAPACSTNPTHRRSNRSRPSAPAPRSRAASERLARQLALAYWIERTMDADDAASAVDIAARLGVSRARVSQVMNLLSLAPDVQEAILLGRFELGERSLRGVPTRGAEPR